MINHDEFTNISLLKKCALDHPSFLIVLRFFPGTRNELACVIKRLNKGGCQYFDRYIR